MRPPCNSRCAWRGRGRWRPSSSCWSCRPDGIHGRCAPALLRECPVLCRRGHEQHTIAHVGDNAHLAGIGELAGVAPQVEEHLRDAPRVAAARGMLSAFHVQRSFLRRSQGLPRRNDRLDHILNGECVQAQHQLTGFDLAEVEHVVAETQEVREANDCSRPMSGANAPGRRRRASRTPIGRP